MKKVVICNTKIIKSRGWCITINNYSQAEVKALSTLKCEYLFQEETGENGTPHLQGMLYYKNAVPFKTVKELFPRAHIEKMKNKIASIKYCSKEDTRSGKIYTNIKDFKKIDTVDTDTVTSKKIKRVINVQDVCDRLEHCYKMYKEGWELEYFDEEAQHYIELMENKSLWNEVLPGGQLTE